MNPDRWQQIKHVFSSALELSGDARMAYVRRACGDDTAMRAEVLALLESSEESEDFIEEPALGDMRSMVGKRIGPYRITELVGEGGMGVVYAAVRDDEQFQQKIAVKVMKRGMDTDVVLRRFRTERQILARLDHPNIARLFDGGLTADGLPYFVMEYLPGTPIFQFCESRRLGVADRLRLFLPVCAAVQYAHQNLVIHRDIKSTNILVSDEGVPKLLDFGIAKLLAVDTSTPAPPATVTSLRMMTPDYASPEQVHGESITTAADVYSLGVLLYELLSGQRPFDFSTLPAEEVARRIDAVEPVRPSAAAPPGRARQLVGDLDTIVLMAMQKQAARRYVSAQALAEDITRYLEGRPLLARPDTVRYRTAKFLRRHRMGVAAAAGVTVALFAGGGVAIWQAAEAATERQAAERRVRDVRDLANALLFELDESLAAVPGSIQSRQLLIRRVLQYLDSLSHTRHSDAALQRELAMAYERSGDIQGSAKGANLGDSAEALRTYRKALEIFEQLSREHPIDVQFLRDCARGYSKVSDLLAVTGDHQAAFQYARKVLEIRERLVAGNPDRRELKAELGAAYQELSGDLSRAGDMVGALAYREKSFQVFERLYREDPTRGETRRGYALASKRLGRLLGRNGDLDAAERCFREALDIETADLAADPLNPATRINLSFTYYDMGDTYLFVRQYRQAREAYQKALQIREALAAADPHDFRVGSALAATHLKLGQTLLRLRDSAAGRAHLAVSLKQRQALSAVNPTNLGAREEVAEAYTALGDAAMETQGCRDAVGWYTKARDISAPLHLSGSLSAFFVEELARIDTTIGRCSTK